jgi:hypothetical protein
VALYYCAIAGKILLARQAGTNQTVDAQWTISTDVNINMGFEIIGEITNIETIAVGRSIREVARLQKVYGPGRWRKLKGMATVRLSDGTVSEAEVHWYEAHGIGKKEIKIKRILWE